MPGAEITSYKDFPGLIRTMPNWITSESPTIHPKTECFET